MYFEILILPVFKNVVEILQYFQIISWPCVLIHFLHMILRNENCLWEFNKYEFHFTSYFVLCPKATAEANNLAAVATAKDTYNKKMEEVRIK